MKFLDYVDYVGFFIGLVLIILATSLFEKTKEINWLGIITGVGLLIWSLEELINNKVKKSVKKLEDRISELDQKWEERDL